MFIFAQIFNFKRHFCKPMHDHKRLITYARAFAVHRVLCKIYVRITMKVTFIRVEHA